MRVPPPPLWTVGRARRVVATTLAALLAVPAGLAWLGAASDRPALPAAAVRLDVNAASAGELETLPNIGPARARGIVASRAELGPFADVDDLERVRGIGPRTVRSLRPYAKTGE